MAAIKKKIEELQAGFEACAECRQQCFKIHRKGKDIANFSSSPSYFFKDLVDGDFHKFLLVPPVFVERLQYQGFQNAFLEGPSGQMWIVTVSCTSKRMVFAKGWQTFVSDHSLDVGDLLVFKYLGESYFIVQIFGRSGCEKRDAFTVRKCEPCSINGGSKKQQKSREGSAEISQGKSDETCIYLSNMRNGDSQDHQLPISVFFLKSNTGQIIRRKRKRHIKSKDSVASKEDILKLETSGGLNQGKESCCDGGESVNEAWTTNNFKKSRAAACASQYHVLNQDNPLLKLFLHCICYMKPF